MNVYQDHTVSVLPPGSGGTRTLLYYRSPGPNKMNVYEDHTVLYFLLDQVLLVHYFIIDHLAQQDECLQGSYCTVLPPGSGGTRTVHFTQCTVPVLGCLFYC